MNRRIFTVFALTACAVLMIFANVNAQEKKLPMKKTVIPKNEEGWINIGVFDTATGFIRSTVVITDSAGNAIRNINDIKQGQIYILRNNNNGLWVVPPGLPNPNPNKKGYLEVSTILEANSVVRIVSDIFVSKDRYFMNSHWVRVKVIKNNS